MSKNTFHDTNIAVKTGFTSMLVLMLLFGVYSLYQLKNISVTMTGTLASNSKKIMHVVVVRDAIRKRQIIMAEMLSTVDAFKREERSIIFYELSGVVREELAKLNKLSINNSENKMLQIILDNVQLAQDFTRKAISILTVDNTSEEGRQLITNAQSSQKNIYKLLGELINLQNKNIQESVTTSKEKYKITLFFSIFLAIFIALIAYIIAKTLTKIITLKNEELIVKNEQLEQVSQQAQSATQAKSDFLAIMSHELRTPLTSIIGFAEALTERSTKIKNRMSITKIIIKNGKHLLTIINDILDISKIEANKMEFENTYFSPVNLLEDVDELIGEQFKEKNISLKVEYEYPFPKVIYNDALRTKQIILNLCSNALKFTKVGKVSIKLHSEIESEKIFFTVADSGVGLTAEQEKNVFNAFTQADTSTARKYGGTGLGLSLSKMFAEKMGGAITVNSRLGVGSQFTVSIGTGKINKSQLVESVFSQPDKGDNITFKYDSTNTVKGSILIAEDNEDNQQLLSILLADIGADVCFVENGQQAIDKALQKKYDLILMDMQMPVMGGLEAIKILRKSNYTNPIIVLSANAMRNDVDRCAQAGCDDFLTKPINKEKLFQAIYKHLEPIEEKIDDSKIESDVFKQHNIRIRALIVRFVESLPEKIQLIDSHRNSKSWDEMQGELHKLKGIGSSMGYPMLTKISAELEYEVIRKNVFEIDSLLIKMKNISERIVKSIPTVMDEKKECKNEYN